MDMDEDAVEGAEEGEACNRLPWSSLGGQQSCFEYGYETYDFSVHTHTVTRRRYGRTDAGTKLFARYHFPSLLTNSPLLRTMPANGTHSRRPSVSVRGLHFADKDSKVWRTQSAIVSPVGAIIDDNLRSVGTARCKPVPSWSAICKTIPSQTPTWIFTHQSPVM